LSGDLSLGGGNFGEEKNGDIREEKGDPGPFHGVGEVLVHLGLGKVNQKKVGGNRGKKNTQQQRKKRKEE